MRALLFKNKLYYKTDYPEPAPQDNEALIRVTHAGICNTDLEIIKGYMGFQGVPGHEFAGVVEETREKGLAGKRVAGEINITCGICSYCRGLMPNHCADRSVLGIMNKDGAFAEYLTLPARNLHVLPDSVSDEEAVFIEPLAAAFEILKQVDIRPSSNVCILGDGKLGLLVGQVISGTNCTPVVVGKHKDKLSLLESMEVRTSLRSDFREKDFDIVIDCTGSPDGVDAALKIVRPEGKVILKTTVARERPVDLNRLVVNEINIIGSRCGPFSRAIEAISNRQIHTEKLVSRVFKLEDGIKAFEYASRRDVLKVIFEIR